MLRHFALLLASAALLSSCSSSTPSGPAAASEFVHAHAGSTFTFDEYSTDSMNMVVAGSRDTMVSTVLRTDGVAGNATGLLVVEERKRSSKDTMCYGYEPNNNFSVYYLGSSSPLMTIPVGTGIVVNQVTADTTIDQGDTSITRDTTLTTPLGTENITVKGQPVSSKKFQFTLREVTMLNGSRLFTGSSDLVLNYAASLGYFVKTASPSRSRPDPFGGWSKGRIQTLIDYNLK